MYIAALTAHSLPLSFCHPPPSPFVWFARHPTLKPSQHVDHAAVRWEHVPVQTGADKISEGADNILGTAQVYG